MADFYYQCVNCHRKWDANEFRYLCPDCSKENSLDTPLKGVLYIHYDNQRVSKKQKWEDILLSVWPLESKDSWPVLRIGHTPLYSFSKLEGKNLGFELLIKDESQNPSYSFKDRASALVSAYAKEQGIYTIVTASTGNAGSSLAAICASQNQKAIILLPKTAPPAKMVQVQMYGAELIRVDGNYDQAFADSIVFSEENGYLNRNTAYNPFTIEGKKSFSFEVFGQMNGAIPDIIFVSVGDGVIISGIYKGFEDLLKLGLIDAMPLIIAVQAEGSANIIDNIDTDNPDFPESHTIADSISVNIPANFYMTLDYLKKYQSEGLKVNDNEIMKAAKMMATSFGVFAEPASAAAFAGFIKWKINHQIRKEAKVLVLHSGSGLKDIKAAQSYLKASND